MINIKNIFIKLKFKEIKIKSIGSCFGGSLAGSESGFSMSGRVIRKCEFSQIRADHVELLIIKGTLISTLEKTLPVWMATTEPTISGVIMQSLKCVFTGFGLAPGSVHSFLAFLTFIKNLWYLCFKFLANLLLYLAGNNSTIYSFDNFNRASMSFPLYVNFFIERFYFTPSI